MLRTYLAHLYCVIADNREIRIGLGSSVIGGVSYKVGEVVKVNTIWDTLAHILLILSIAGAAFALFRGMYTFRKEWRADRLKALKEAKEIKTLQAEIK